MSVMVESKVSSGTCWNADGNPIEYRVIVVDEDEQVERLLCRGCTVDAEREATTDWNDPDGPALTGYYEAVFGG